MPRFMVWIGALFAGIGALFLAISAAGYLADQSHIATAKEAQGTVINLTQSRGSNGPTFAPVVEWRDAKGRRHVLYSNTGSNPPAFARGEKVRVLYDPADPNKAKVDSFGQRFTLILIFAGLGLVFSLIGGPILYLFLRRKRVIARLKHSGERIEAKFLRCDVDRSTVVNGRSPYRVHAQGKHPKTGRLASFVSGPIWVDLTSTLAGKTIPVLVNRKRYRDHYVMLDEWVAEDETA
ncbi:MAG: DUF3592 domain-containing protein [Pseudomonadota bacterium]